MAIAGKGGSLWAGGSPTKVAEAGSWDFEVAGQAIDTTALDATWATKIAGMPSWSGSATANLVMSDTAQAALFANITGCTTTPVEFRLSDSHKFAGTAVVTSFKVDASVNDKVSVSFTFEGTGALAYT